MFDVKNAKFVCINTNNIPKTECPQLLYYSSYASATTCDFCHSEKSPEPHGSGLPKKFFYL